MKILNLKLLNSTSKDEQVSQVFSSKCKLDKFYNVTHSVDKIVQDYLSSHEPSTYGVLYDYKKTFGHDFVIFLFNYTLTLPP